MVSSFAVFEQNTFICWLWCRRLVVEHKSFRSLLRCANICGIAFTSCSFLSIPYPRFFSSIIPYPEDSPFKIFTTLRFFREFLTGYSWWRLRKSIWKKKNPNNETKTKRTSKHRKRGSIVLIKIARCEGLGTSGDRCLADSEVTAVVVYVRKVIYLQVLEVAHIINLPSLIINR